MLVFLCLLSSPLTDRGYSSWWYSFSAYSPRRLLTVNLSLDATLSLFTLSPLTDRGPLHKNLFAFFWCYSFSVYSPLPLLTVDPYTKVFLPSLNATLSLLTLLAAYWPWTLTQKAFCLLLMLLFLCLLSSPLTDSGTFSWCYSFSVYSPRRLLTVDPYTKVFLPSLDATLSLLTLLAAYWPWILFLMQLFHCLLSSPLTDSKPLHKSLFAFSWCYFFSAYSLRRLLTVDRSLDATLPLFTVLAAYWPWILLLMLLFLCLHSSPLTDRGPLHKSLFAFSWCYSFSAYSPRRLLHLDHSLDATLSLVTLLAAYWP